MAGTDFYNALLKVCTYFEPDDAYEKVHFVEDQARFVANVAELCHIMRKEEYSRESIRQAHAMLSDFIFLIATDEAWSYLDKLNKTFRRFFPKLF